MPHLVSKASLVNFSLQSPWKKNTFLYIYIYFLFGCCFWNLFFCLIQITFSYLEKMQPPNAEIQWRRKHLHSGVLWSPPWETHRMNEAVHKEWCQPPCSTKSSHLLDCALEGRGQKFLTSQAEAGGIHSTCIRTNVFTGVQTLPNVGRIPGTKTNLLRTEESVTTLSFRGWTLVWADSLLRRYGPNNLKFR